MVGVKNELGGAFGMKKALAFAALLLLGACQTTPPPAPTPAPLPPPVTHPKVVKHGPLKPPTNVASAGPLKSAMVGDYMDAQEKDFRTHLRPVAIMRVGDDLIVSLGDTVLFGEGDALSGHGHDTVERVAELLRRYDHSSVQVAGYMDTALAPDSSMALSQLRAKTIADALVSDGVPQTRISSQGFGSGHLKIATGPSTTEPRNRRIEIRVIAHPDADAPPPAQVKQAAKTAPPPQLRKEK